MHSNEGEAEIQEVNTEFDVIRLNTVERLCSGMTEIMKRASAHFNFPLAGNVVSSCRLVYSRKGKT